MAQRRKRKQLPVHYFRVLCISKFHFTINIYVVHDKLQDSHRITITITFRLCPVRIRSKKKMELQIAGYSFDTATTAHEALHCSILDS